MTVASTLNKKHYEGNGLTTEFPLPFDAADKAHIFAVVKKGLEISDVITNYDVDLSRKVFIYPVSGTPLQAGEKLTVYRKIPLTQVVDLENAGAFHPEVLEHDGFDRIVMQIQQLDEAISRALKIDITDTRDVSGLLQELFTARDEAVLMADSAKEEAGKAKSGAELAKAWAESGENPDPADPESRSAKYWALKAAEIIPFADYEQAGKVQIDRESLAVDEKGLVSVRRDLLDLLSRHDADIAEINAFLDAYVLAQAFFAGDFKISHKHALDGFLLCDGSAVSRKTYAALFAVIGTAYGAGDGSTTFSLPDLRGRFIQGAVQGEGGDLGEYKEAGLPNITGHVDAPVSNAGKFSGALFFDTTGKSTVLTNNSYCVKFDASRSNPIYGNSSTVQPPAAALNVFIKY